VCLLRLKGKDASTLGLLFVSVVSVTAFDGHVRARARARAKGSTTQGI